MGEHRPSVMVKCARCGVEFRTHQSLLDRGGSKFCGMACSRAALARKRVALNCQQCDKEFRVVAARAKEPDRGKYCSKDCFHAAQTGRPFRPMEERFWEKVDKRGDDECWPWIGGSERHGYGRFFDGTKYGKASHTAWKLRNGPIPEGMDILHSCDNPPCVNPKHLFPGTQQQNMEDKVAKGRQNRGETSPLSRLTEPEVRAIYSRFKGGESARLVAAECGVGLRTVYDIGTGRTWRHVTGEPKRES